MNPRRSTFFLLLGLAGALVIFLALPSCQTPPAAPPTVTALPAARVLSSPTATDAARTTLLIATFNIQNLGPTKMSKPAVVAELVSLVRKYDLVAVQEIDDSTLKTAPAFLEKINGAPGPRYGMVVSPISGTTATSGQNEQYAFYFNAEKVETLDTGQLYPDPADKFIREPFAAQFKARGSSESFVLLTIHTEATKAGTTREISALAPAAQWAEERYNGELGVVVLGDYNAGVTYLSVPQVTALRNTYLPHRWIVPDNADTTNSSQQDQAHDRMVVIGAALDARFTGRWGVDTTVSSKTVSDHLPVWAEFSFERN